MVMLMGRKEELLEYLGGNENRVLIERTIDEVIAIEEQLSRLRKLPFIKVHPENPEIQKATPASRLYVSLLAQYNVNIRTLARLAGKSEVEEDSPLRGWARNRVNPE